MKLTLENLRLISTDDPRGRRVMDESLPGFGVTILPGGGRSYFVRYGPRTRRRFMVIGEHPAMTLDAARRKAREVLAAAQLGGDPVADRDRAAGMPTWDEWVIRYLESVKITKKRPQEDVRYLGGERTSTRGGRRSYFFEEVRRRWGRRPIDQITTDDVDVVRQTIGKEGHRASANRWLASVAACFASARRAGHIKVNPASGLRPYRENPPRARTLTAEEMEKLLGAIAQEDDPWARVAMTVLVETGMRVSEVLRAKWEDVDLDAAVWRLPSPKSGRPQVLPLAATTVRALRQLPRVGPYVIPGMKPEVHRYDIRGPWERALERAGLTDAEIHVHDVRRTFGLTVAREAGLHVASRLLRHRDIKVTERVYAPLGLDDLRVAMERRAEVLPFRTDAADGSKKSRG